MRILILLAALTIFAACSSTKQVAAPKSDGALKYDESFDPNSLNDDDIVIAKLENKMLEEKNRSNELQLSESEIKFREASGFRVQLIATKNIEAATLTEQEARDIFDTMKHTIYLVFEAPLYKVRVGDFLTRNDAEEIKDTAKDYGYHEAFIVPSKVNVPVNAPY